MMPMVEGVPIGNIGRPQCRHRIVFGGIMLVFAAIAAVSLIAAGSAWPWRLVTFMPTWIGVLAILESRSRTCVILAARGIRDIGAGREAIRDSGAMRRHREAATRVYVQATLIAGLLVATFALW